MTLALARAAVLAVSIITATACGGDDGRDVAPRGPSSERLALHPLGSVDGAPNGYVEYLPPGYGDGKPRPLLVSLHGSGENGNGRRGELELLTIAGLGALIRNDEWPESRPFVVLMPQHEGGDVPGSLCPDTKEIEAFLRFATEHYEIDRRRVYLTGLSCGAYGGWDYLAAHGTEVVAAAVLIAGDGNPALAEAGCSLARVPIWAVHGDSDTVVSPYGSIRPITRMKTECGTRAADLRLTVLRGVGHGAWTATFDGSAGIDVWAWLLRHENG
jgi:predicted peptidase